MGIFFTSELTRATRANKTSQLGFTLLELMITLAILAVILSIGVPSMQSAMEKRRTVSAAEAIYSQIQLARSESISRSSTLFMNISGGSTWAIGFGTDQNCDPTDNNPACTLPDQDNANAITQLLTSADHNNVSVTTTSNQITFSPQRGTATNATISVNSSGNMGYIVNVVVGILGQVSLCSPNTDPTNYVAGYRACT
jgi:prepilin-type N-terminal cleavage/methylation domain-containing protein